jgi:hypothetical protein
MSDRSLTTFRFISAEILNGWLQLLDVDGVSRCVRLEWVTAMEHDPGNASITIYADDLVWRFGSGITPTPALDLNVHEARRDDSHALYQRLRRELVAPRTGHG